MAVTALLIKANGEIEELRITSHEDLHLAVGSDEMKSINIGDYMYSPFVFFNRDNAGSLNIRINELLNNHGDNYRRYCICGDCVLMDRDACFNIGDEACHAHSYAAEIGGVPKLSGLSSELVDEIENQQGPWPKYKCVDRDSLSIFYGAATNGQST